VIERSATIPLEMRPAEMARERQAVLRLDDVPTWTTMHLMTLSFAMTYCVIDAWYKLRFEDDVVEAILQEEAVCQLRGCRDAYFHPTDAFDPRIRQFTQDTEANARYATRVTTAIRAFYLRERAVLMKQQGITDADLGLPDLLPDRA